MRNKGRDCWLAKPHSDEIIFKNKKSSGLQQQKTWNKKGNEKCCMTCKKRRFEVTFSFLVLSLRIHWHCCSCSAASGPGCRARMCFSSTYSFSFSFTGRHKEDIRVIRERDSSWVSESFLIRPPNHDQVRYVDVLHMVSLKVSYYTIFRHILYLVPSLVMCAFVCVGRGAL